MFFWKVKGKIGRINHAYMLFNFTLKVGIKSLLLEAPIMFAEGLERPDIFTKALGWIRLSYER